MTCGLGESILSAAPDIDVSDDIRIHDLGSTNGVLVNGEETAGVEKVTPDDLVMIGETVLRFRVVVPTKHREKPLVWRRTDRPGGEVQPTTARVPTF